MNKNGIVILLLFLGGCQLPQWKVGEAKVPAPIVKTAPQIEAERGAAKVIADKVETPEPLKPLAIHLSQSLGEPNSADITIEAADLHLITSLRAQQQELVKLNIALGKLTGKTIQGTGVNLFGWAGGAGVLALIIACVLCPSLIGIVWWFMRRGGSALKYVVQGVENYTKLHPAEAKELKQEIKDVTTVAHKATIERVIDNLKTAP